MIVSLLINRFQELKNVQLNFTNEKNLYQPETSSWQKHGKNYISRCVVIYGSHIAGKTIVYNCIYYLWQLITNDKLLQFLNSDIEIVFSVNQSTCKYCVKTNSTGVINDRVFIDGIEQNAKNKSYILNSIIRSWFQQLLFIESSYEYPKEKMNLVQSINSEIEKINENIKDYVNEIWWDNIDYPNLFLSKDINGNIIMKMPNKTINISCLQKSTLELLSLLPILYQFLREKEPHILVIDDITYIAKQRLLQILNDEYITRLSLIKNKQLIVFSDNYDKNAFGYYSKTINLEEL